jgi:hypothetical protein
MSDADLESMVEEVRKLSGRIGALLVAGELGNGGGAEWYQCKSKVDSGLAFAVANIVAPRETVAWFGHCLGGMLCVDEKTVGALLEPVDSAVDEMLDELAEIYEAVEREVGADVVGVEDEDKDEDEDEEGKGGVRG